MFYTDKPSQALRFGDVVRGFVSATPEMRAPLNSGEQCYLKVEVDQPTFHVVLSPCCSIGEKVLSLAPLIELRPGFFRNPYFTADMSRINRQMSPEDAVPPNVWEHLSAEEKQKRLEQGLSYSLLDVFVYLGHDLLPKYVLPRKEGNVDTNDYMIDFRHAFRVNCETVVTPGNSPLAAKLLELTVATRTELREKISYFFRRVPDEDLAETA